MLNKKSNFLLTLVLALTLVIAFSLFIVAKNGWLDLRKLFSYYRSSGPTGAFPIQPFQPLFENVTENETNITFAQPGLLIGIGRKFSLNSNWLNITLTSNFPINLKLEIIPETIFIDINSTQETEINLSGLTPNQNYYAYAWDYHNKTTFNSGSAGTWSFSVPSGQLKIWIQPRSSTKFINDTETGGDCTTIGIWSPETKTCTLTQNVSETIQIDVNGTTLDCAGFTISGNGTGFGVFVPGNLRRDVVVKNCAIKNFSIGILFSIPAAHLQNWNLNGSILNNSVFQNGEGIHLMGTNHKAIENKIFNNSGFGLVADRNINSFFLENTVFNNTFGINIFESRNLTLSDNNFTDNIYNFISIWPLDPEFLKHNITNTNTVDGKPVFYLFGITNQIISPQIISPPQGIGWIGCANCTNVTFENFEMDQKNYQGVLFQGANSTIRNLKISKSLIGLQVAGENLQIENITVFENEMGIRAWGINHTYKFINASSNLEKHHPCLFRNCPGGFSADALVNSTVIFSNFTNNTRGIQLSYSDGINITNNKIIGNIINGIGLFGAGFNLIQNELNNNRLYGSAVAITAKENIFSQSSIGLEDRIWLAEFINNTFFGGGISIFKLAWNIKFVNNTFFGVHFSIGGDSFSTKVENNKFFGGAISFRGRDKEIFNNEFINITSFDILLNCGDGNFTIKNNTILTLGRGISISAVQYPRECPPRKQFTIINNTISGATWTAAISLSNLIEDVLISNNNLLNSFIGILLGAVKNVSIEGNKIINTTYGIANWPQDTRLISQTVFTPGNWYHLATTYDGEKARLYVNGVLEKEIPRIGSISYSNREIFFGGPGEFIGLVDEVSFYSDALSYRQVQQIFAAESQGLTKPICGNGIIEIGELCDGENITSSCSDIGLGPGNLSCAANCEFDTTGCSQPGCLTPPSGLVAWWPADGNVLDYVGLNHGILSPGANFSSGKFGLAFSFDGDDFIESSTKPFEIKNNFTIEFWALPNATISAPGAWLPQKRFAIFSEGRLGAAGVGVALGNDKIEIWEHGDNYLISPIGVTTQITNWTHIAIVYENKKPKIYLNGIKVAEGLVNPIFLVGSASERAVRDTFPSKTFGFPGFSAYSGLLDEIRIYNRSLTDMEISELFNATAGICKPATPQQMPKLVSWWRGEGNTNDSFGSNHGIPINLTYAQGKVGLAFNLSPSSWFKVPDSMSLKPEKFTLTALVMPMTNTSTRPIINKDYVLFQDWNRLFGSVFLSVFLLAHQNVNIINNTLTSNTNGIILVGREGNISGNTISNSDFGLNIQFGRNYRIENNTFQANEQAVLFNFSWSNFLGQNNFFENNGTVRYVNYLNNNIFGLIPPFEIDTPAGNITYLQPVNVLEEINLDQFVSIKPNRISVTHPNLNQSANLTFKDIGLWNPVPVIENDGFILPCKESNCIPLSGALVFGDHFKELSNWTVLSGNWSIVDEKLFVNATVNSEIQKEAQFSSDWQFTIEKQNLDLTTTWRDYIALGNGSHWIGLNEEAWNKRFGGWKSTPGWAGIFGSQPIGGGNATKTLKITKSGAIFTFSVIQNGTETFLGEATIPELANVNFSIIILGSVGGSAVFFDNARIASCPEKIGTGCYQMQVPHFTTYGLEEDIECGFLLNKSRQLDKNLTCSDIAIEIATDNITFDCGGYWLIGAGLASGIKIKNKKNITIKNCNIKGFEIGINVSDSTKINLLENNISENAAGIAFQNVNLSNAFANEFNNNPMAIALENSKLINFDQNVINNSIQAIIALSSSENNFSAGTINNGIGFLLLNSQNNLINLYNFFNITNSLITDTFNNTVSWTSLENPVFISQFGNLTYGQISITEPINFATVLNISLNRVLVNSAAAPELNKSATITLLGIDALNPFIAVDDEDDGIFVPCEMQRCQLIETEPIIFNVTHFTTYAISGNLTLTIWDETDFVKRYQGDSVNFFANFTNAADQPPENASCEIAFNGNWSEMQFNSSSQLFEFNTAFAEAGNFNFTVRCRAPLVSQIELTAKNEFTISPTVPLTPPLEVLGESLSRFKLPTPPTPPIQPIKIEVPPPTAPKITCRENWVCEDWGPCLPEGFKYRKCLDLNNCGTYYWKPITRQSCVYIPPIEISAPPTEIPAPVEEEIPAPPAPIEEIPLPKPKPKINLLLILIIDIVLILLIILFLISIRKKKDRMETLIEKWEKELKKKKI